MFSFLIFKLITLVSSDVYLQFFFFSRRFRFFLIKQRSRAAQPCLFSLFLSLSYF